MILGVIICACRCVIARRQKIQKSPRGFLPRPLLRADKSKNKISRGFAKSFPQKIVSAKPSPHFAPPHSLNTCRAEPQKKNILSFFKRNFAPAKSEMQGVFFFRGCRGSARRWRGDCSSVRFRSEPRALRAYDIICFENRCAGEDLHLHVLADTSPSSWPVF